ncbi:MAG: peptidase [Lysobacterales bacterium CG02_land_8_20_14_3_00_62_12]|nr:MAG: peptidase [Xanthomonadales bacterium CG02_land_8_20_14_3_00_62_12]
MIRSFRHQGIEAFFQTGSTANVQAKHVARLRLQLARLNVAREAKDMNAPGWKLHLLKGRLKDQWAVSVSGNWRLAFTFEHGDAVLVDYQDYH